MALQATTDMHACFARAVADGPAPLASFRGAEHLRRAEYVYNQHHAGPGCIQSVTQARLRVPTDILIAILSDSYQAQAEVLMNSKVRVQCGTSQASMGTGGWPHTHLHMAPRAAPPLGPWSPLQDVQLGKEISEYVTTSIKRIPCVRMCYDRGGQAVALARKRLTSMRTKSLFSMSGGSPKHNAKLWAMSMARRRASNALRFGARPSSKLKPGAGKPAALSSALGGLAEEPSAANESQVISIDGQLRQSPANVPLPRRAAPGDAGKSERERPASSTTAKSPSGQGVAPVAATSTASRSTAELRAGGITGPRVATGPGVSAAQRSRLGLEVLPGSPAS